MANRFVDDVGYFCKWNDVIRRAGSGASGVKSDGNIGELSGGIAVSAAAMNDFIESAENTINVATAHNFYKNYDSLTSGVKSILRDTAARMAANDLIGYSFEGYPTRLEAENLININRDAYLRNIAILRDKKKVDFVNAA